MTAPHKVIILGSGPAGLTAALYAGRALLEPLVLEGPEPGGQLTITTEVENYPGFPEGIQGPELIEKLREQARKFGARFVRESPTAVELTRYPFRIVTEGKEYLALSLIIATGARAKKLGVKGEKEFTGKGVSSCATCDGFFFRNQRVIVVGGGDSAMEEALFLTRFASEVTIVHRRDRLRASPIMQERARAHPKIHFLWDTVVEEILGDEDKGVTGVLLKNLKTGEMTHKEVEGVFVAIGHEPNTSLFRGQLDMDEQGYLRVKEPTSATNIPGIFAAGDVHDPHYRQAITAAGAGCRAALDAERWLSALKLERV